MKVVELIRTYKENKKTDKSDFAQNVHKSYQSYIDRVDENASVDEAIKDLDRMFEGFDQHLNPNSKRNYVRLVEDSLEREPLVNIISEEVRKGALDKIRQVLPTIDHAANEHKKNIAANRGKFVKLDNRDDVIETEIPCDVNETSDIESSVHEEMQLDSLEVKSSREVKSWKGLEEEIMKLKEENVRLSKLVAKMEIEKGKDEIRLEICERLWKIIESKH